jgi:hypothetical protein
LLLFNQILDSGDELSSKSKAYQLKKGERLNADHASLMTDEYLVEKLVKVSGETLPRAFKKNILLADKQGGCLRYAFIFF